MENSHADKAYLEYRKRANDGDVVAARGGNSIIGNVIEKVTHSNLHHVGMVFWWHHNLMVIEALAQGISCGLLSQWLSRDYGAIDVYRLTPELPFVSSLALHSATYDMRRVKYDFQGIGNLAMYELFGLDQREEQDKNRSFCSAAVTRWIKDGGVNAFKKDDNLVTPADFGRSQKFDLVGAF